MTEPQVWVLIGVFAASMFGMIGIVTSNFTRALRSEIGGLRAEMIARFETVEVRFQSIEKQLEHLDRDVTALIRRVTDSE